MTQEVNNCNRRTRFPKTEEQRSLKFIDVFVVSIVFDVRSSTISISLEFISSVIGVGGYEPPVPYMVAPTTIDIR